MNFFGHAAAASWATDEPGALLGAMLPDFATMIGARLADAVDPVVASGIAMHHRADSVFHVLPPVLALMRELGARLDAAGCARGPARAVAHIGTELLLDGVLVGEAAYRDAYLAALEADVAGVRWREPHGADRFPVLMSRLRAYGVPEDLRSSEHVAQRLARVLGGRPRLAPSADDLRAIRAALADQQPRIEVAAETVMRAMRAGLADTYLQTPVD